MYQKKGGLNEDISAKTGVLDFSSGTANFRTSLPTNRGFGQDMSSLFTSNNTNNKFPKWTGTQFINVSENSYINSEHGQEISLMEQIQELLETSLLQ